MYVEKILFDVEALKGVSGGLEKLIFGDVRGLAFDVSPSSKLDAAVFAARDGIVGVVVGKRQDGTPAILTGEFNFHSVSHG